MNPLRTFWFLTIACLLVVAAGVTLRAQVFPVYPGIANPNTGITSYSASIAPQASTSALGSFVLKASPGAVYQVTASNAAAAGFLVLLNATVAPSGGAAILPLACRAISSGGTTTITYSPGPPGAYNVGVVAAVTTSAAGCFTFTTTTAYFEGLVM